MKIISSFLFLLLILTAFNTSAQSIKGKVISLETGEALDKVTIELNGRTVSQSGEEGEFEITGIKKFPVSVNFRRLGYGSKELTFEAENKEVIAALAEELPGTDEIKVNSTIFSKSGMLNSFYLRSGINTIDELLERAPGLTVVKRGNYASEPVIRGLNSDRLSITLNGMKIQSACTDKMDPVTSYAETGNLESVELSRASFTCGKCSNKQGGVDLRLKDASTLDRFRLNGSLSTGFMTVSNSKLADARINLGSVNYGSTVNFIYRSSGDYKTGSGSRVNYSGYNKINLTNSHIFKPNDNLEFTAEILYDFAWDIGYPALTMDVKTAEAFIAGIGFKTREPFNNINSIEGKVYYNFVNHLMDDSHRDNRIKMDMPGWTTTKGAYLKGNFFFGKFTGDIKTDASITTARAEMTMYVPGSIPMFMLTWPDVLKNDVSVSMNLKRNIGKQIIVSAGAGVSFISSSIEDELGYGELSIFYPKFSGKESRLAGSITGGFKVNFPEGFSGGLHYSFIERDLSISEQYAFYIFNRQDAYDYIGDPFINNEKLHQAELSGEYTNGRFKAGLNVFYYKFNNYIIGLIDNSLSAMTEGANGVKIYSNIPSAEISGFESTLEAGITGDLSIVNSIQYTRGTDNSGGSLPQIAPLSGTLSARYSRGILSVQLETIWASRQERVDIKYGESVTPSFAVINLRGGVKLLDRLTLSAGVENILNKEYYEHLDWQKIPRPGRNFYLTIKTDF